MLRWRSAPGYFSPPAAHSRSLVPFLPVCVCRALPSLARRMSRVICAWTMTARALSEQILFPLSRPRPPASLPPFFPPSRNTRRSSCFVRLSHDARALGRRCPPSQFSVAFPPLWLSPRYLSPLARSLFPSLHILFPVVRSGRRFTRPLPLVTVPFSSVARAYLMRASYSSCFSSLPSSTPFSTRAHLY